MVTQSRKSQSFPSSGIKAYGFHLMENGTGALAQAETNGGYGLSHQPVLLTSEQHSSCIYLGLGSFSAFLGRKLTKPYDISGRGHDFTQKLSCKNFAYGFPLVGSPPLGKA